MNGIQLLKTILLIFDLANEAKTPNRADSGAPYRVTADGGVVDRDGSLVYEANSLQPGDAEIIVAIYNGIGWFDWDEIAELVELLNESENSDGD